MTGHQLTSRVVVAMSGGVDSSVTAALLQREGYDVIGVTMKTYDFDGVGGNQSNETSCCGLGAVQDARLVATKLGIPHYVVDFREEFGREVIRYFVREYLNGRTPNPCVECNREIKWKALLRKSEALGATLLATGHYARIRRERPSGRFAILKGVDDGKDQSYALWGLSQDALAKTMFPLGGYTKPEVRALAEEFELRNARKDESYEICFVADNDYERFLKEQRPEIERSIGEGPIVLRNRVVGRHRGYPFYTIGQRKGIGAHGQKMYVTGIEPEANRIRIGPDAELLGDGLIATRLNWVGVPGFDGPARVTVKVRYKDEPATATASLEGQDRLRISFDKPKRAITPGQSVVLYRDDVLLAGGVIDAAIRAS